LFISTIKVLHTDFNQLVRKDVIEDDPTLQKPGQEEIDKTAEETRLALEKIIEHKVSAAQPVRAPEKSSPDKYIRFTPAQQGPGYNSGNSFFEMLHLPNNFF
jgi:SNW domain-containing protein 1